MEGTGGSLSFDFASSFQFGSQAISTKDQVQHLQAFALQRFGIDHFVSRSIANLSQFREHPLLLDSSRFLCTKRQGNDRNAIGFGSQCYNCEQ
jgi:hypothetical protein